MSDDADADRWPARPRRPAQPMLIARDLSKHFPVKGGAASRCRRSTACRSPSEGRDPGHRRRVRLRQVHPRAAAAASGRARCRRAGIRRRPGRRAATASPSMRCAARCRWCSRIRYSSLNPRMPVRDSVAFGPFVQGKRKAGRARDIARDMLAQGRARPRPVRAALSARAVRRPEAAGQHRPRPGDRAAHGDPRRAGLGARQIGRGAGAEPAARAEAAVQPDLSSSSATI